jgi:hypothetical protein
MLFVKLVVIMWRIKMIVSSIYGLLADNTLDRLST